MFSIICVTIAATLWVVSLLNLQNEVFNGLYYIVSMFLAYQLPDLILPDSPFRTLIGVAFFIVSVILFFALHGNDR